MFAHVWRGPRCPRKVSLNFKLTGLGIPWFFSCRGRPLRDAQVWHDFAVNNKHHASAACTGPRHDCWRETHRLWEGNRKPQRSGCFGWKLDLGSSWFWPNFVSSFVEAAPIESYCMLWNDEVCAEPQLWWWKWTPLLMERRPLRSMILTLACTATCVVDIHLSQRSPCCDMSGKLCGSMLLTDFFSLHLAMQRMWFLACEVSLRQFSVGVQAVSQCERQTCWKSYNKVIVSQTQTIGVETSFLLAELLLTLPFRYIEVEKLKISTDGWKKSVTLSMIASLRQDVFFLYSSFCILTAEKKCDDCPLRIARVFVVFSPLLQCCICWFCSSCSALLTMQSVLAGLPSSASFLRTWHGHRRGTGIIARKLHWVCLKIVYP